MFAFVSNPAQLDRKNTEGSIQSRYIRGADKSLAQPGRKLATATEDFEFKVVSCKVVVGKIDIKDVSVHAVAL